MEKMETCHLNWDDNQQNGIILNDDYPWGALFQGSHLKPKLSFEYTDFSYGYALDKSPNFYRDIDGKKHNMTPEQEDELYLLASTWVQEVGQEGNMPTVEPSSTTSTDNMTEGEIISYLHSLSEEDRVIAMQELANKYGLPYENIKLYYEANKPQ